MQTDRRLPFAVGGDAACEPAVEGFMLLRSSCNRAGSRSCELCCNWTTDRLLDVCRVCDWASPEDYAHIVLELIQRWDTVWQGEEVPGHECLATLAAKPLLSDCVTDVPGPDTAPGVRSMSMPLRPT